MLVRCEGPDCTVEFEQTRKGQIYHSNACRQKALRARQKQKSEVTLFERCEKLPGSVTAKIRTISEQYSVDAAWEALAVINILLRIAEAWPKDLREEFQQVNQADQRRIAELEQERELRREEYREALETIGKQERELLRYRRMKLLKSRQSMEQELMVLGGRLNYSGLVDLGIQSGIDQWLAYMRAASDEDLAAAIAHAYYQADSRDVAVVKERDNETAMQMRKHITMLENELARVRAAEPGAGSLETGEERKATRKELEARLQELEFETIILHLYKPEEQEAFHVQLRDAHLRIRDLEYYQRENQLTIDRQTRHIQELEQAQEETGGQEDQHNIESYREKLAQASARISKLEGQVDIQRQRLNQYYVRFYPSSLAVATEKLLALGAALNYKPLLKYDELTVEIASGAQAWQEFARTANYDDMAQAILQAERFQQHMNAHQEQRRAEYDRSQIGDQEAAIHRLIVQEYAARLYLSFHEEPIPFHRNGTTYSIVTGNLPNHKVVAQLGDKQYETLEISEQEAAYFQEYCYRQLYQTYQARLDV